MVGAYPTPQLTVVPLPHFTKIVSTCKMVTLIQSSSLSIQNLYIYIEIDSNIQFVDYHGYTLPV